jgi:hypothetical protein
MLTKGRPLETLDRKLFAKGVTPAVSPLSLAGFLSTTTACTSYVFFEHQTIGGTIRVVCSLDVQYTEIGLWDTSISTVLLYCSDLAWLTLAILCMPNSTCCPTSSSSMLPFPFIKRLRLKIHPEK